MLGVGLLAWAGGEVYYSVFYADLAEPPLPGVSDGLWLTFYPACYVAIVLLVRERVRQFRTSLWLDGLVGALAASAIAAALVFGAIAGQGGEDAVVAVDLSYALGDLLLLGFVVGVFGLTGWRPGRALLLVGAGLVTSAVVDGFFLYESALGLSVDSTLMATLWPASALLLGFAAWQRPTVAEPVRFEGARVLLMPAAFAVAGLALLGWHTFERQNALALGLAIATLAAVIVRMAVTFRENIRLLASSRRDALTDALTGLGNRRALMEDLEVEVAVATESRPSGLVLLDLDGFKQYNDRFGHPMGDALLARLGQRLAEAFPHDRAYRLGGDEFCVLARGSEEMIVEGRRGRPRGAHRARRRLRSRMLLGRGDHPGRRARRRSPRCASRTSACTRARTAASARPSATRRPPPCCRRSRSASRSCATTSTRSRASRSRSAARWGSPATSSTTSRAPPTCTTSARSPCPTRSCRSPASSTRSSGS